jgi:Fibronectin type III domain/FG-GAP-like repeat
MTVRDHRPQWRTRLVVLAATAAIAIPFAVGSGVSATSSLFLPYQAISLGTTDSSAVAIGDVTGDGRADVVVTGSMGYTDYRVVVLAGLANGALDAPVSYASADPGSYPIQTVAIGDVTGDGRADVVVGASHLGIEVFPQLDTGALGAPTLIETQDSLRVAIGNLGGGAGLDVVSIGWGTNTASVFLDDGSGHLAAPAIYPVRHGGYDDLEVGDVSGDGLDDIVVMSGQTYAIPNVSVLPQLAGGGFGAPAEYRVADQVNSSGIGVGDVTLDGLPDVVASYGGNQPSARLAVFAQTTGGLLAAPMAYMSYDIPGPVEVADMDGDGRADVVTLHTGWRKAGVYRNQVGGILGQEELYALPSISSFDPHGLAVGDVTGDGWPDLAIADPNNGLVLLRNTGTGPVPTPSPSTTALPTPGFTYPPTPEPTPVVTPSPTPTPTPTATPKPQLPTAPTGLTTSPNLPSGVGLAWAAPSASGSGPVTGYRIYRGPDGGTGVPLATIGNVLSFTDTTVANGATFWYSVAAVSMYGEGTRSAAAVAQRALPPSAPTSPSASVATGRTGVTVTWKAPTSNGGSPVTGYQIYRGTAAGGGAFLVSVAAGTTTFTDTAVTKKVTYFYRIAAVNVVGEGAPSVEVNTTAR